MTNQTQTQTIVSSTEILKSLNGFPKRKTRKAWLTTAIKKQKQFIYELSETSSSKKNLELATQQLIELVAARQVFLPYSQRIQNLPTVNPKQVLADLLEVKPEVALSRPMASSTKPSAPAKKVTPSPKPTAKAEPAKKATAKAEVASEAMTEVIKSLTELTKSVAELTKVVSQNSNAIAELQKKATAKAEPVAKATAPKATAKAEPKAKATILKDFSQLAMQLPTPQPEKPKADPQTELMARIFAF